MKNVETIWSFCQLMAAKTRSVLLLTGLGASYEEDTKNRSDKTLDESEK